MNKSYTEMCQYSTYEDRLKYLMLHGVAGIPTTEEYRPMLQHFYHTNHDWLNSIRNKVIIRDNGCDLGIDGLEIKTRAILHHINPITIDDILSNNFSKLLDPENLICVTHNTHNCIHYGILPRPVYSERTPNDTCPWR